MDERISYRPIGRVSSPHKSPEGTPIQPEAAEGFQGSVEIFSDFSTGLADLEGFSHVILIYHFHRAGESRLEAEPFMDDSRHGVFATRSPARPNSIGISVVRLKGVEDGTLHLENLDLLDGTPVLDVKPYVPEFDRPKGASRGWLEDNIDKLEEARDDGRFAGD